jgi:hypothetical protein
METTKDIIYFEISCTEPPNLMGDESLGEVTIKWRVELDHGRFENISHVPQCFANLFSVYQITHSGSGKNVEFTPEFVPIFDMQYNSIFVSLILFNSIPLYY